ncbi:hypothetical protein EVAR_54821_1 [Eumeta japonica]|uniref:PiggyBac transposable element-derived protein domain-containing protein n=1 Tax=Eumeta variegata TaxID=151549 RepID=A0A4C1Y3I6_EUMVA|nr:hypothetical protein EVAR_54821_1 [Eumeta japonica]
MASEGSRPGRRMRNGMTDNEITEALDDSDIDFSDTNSDDDPAYLPPELMPLRNCGSSSSDDDERSDDTLLEAQVPSPAISENSLNIPVFVASRGQTRGRARSTNRRGRGRSFARGNITIRSRSSPSLSLNNSAQLSDNWTAEKLEPEALDLIYPAYFHTEREDWEWHQFYDEYIDEEILSVIVNATNRTHILETGKSLGLTLKELKTYLGITMLMSALQYPQIDMYWSAKWRIPAIAKAMTRNRFYFIRKRLKCVYDPDVTTEQKVEKRFGK